MMSLRQQFQQSKAVHSLNKSGLRTIKSLENLLLVGLRLLVIDNNPDARDILTFALQNEGAEVLAIASVKEALRFMRQYQPHAFLCEIMLAEEDGYSLLEQIRHLEVELSRQRTAAIAITTQGLLGEQVRAIYAGFQHYFVKPIDLEQLVFVLAQLKQDVNCQFDYAIDLSLPRNYCENN